MNVGAGFLKGYITCHMLTFIRGVGITNNSNSNNQWLKIIQLERYTDNKMRLDGDSISKEHFLPQNGRDRFPEIPSYSIYYGLFIMSENCIVLLDYPWNQQLF